jgi:hypothetical protein
MAHYAKVNNTIVERVIVAEADFFDTFVDSSPGEWIQTSYNTIEGVHYQPNSRDPSEDQSKAFRKNYAGVGYVFDTERDAFIPPKVYNSWTLNEDTCQWDPPTSYPDDGKDYIWDEATTNWVEIEE